VSTAPADAAVLGLLEGVASPMVLTEGANLFLGPMLFPDAGRPSLCVCVLASGGPLMARLVGSSLDWSTPTVQVMVRADRSDYARGIALARACLAACQAPSSMPSGYSECAVMQGDVAYLSPDQVGRHLWSFNVLLQLVK
jgi:hypothetical protein